MESGTERNDLRILGAYGARMAAGDFDGVSHWTLTGTHAGARRHAA